jgi:hypothetical protein
MLRDDTVIDTPPTWTERLDRYEAAGFPRSLFVDPGGYLVGMMILGNDYRVKSGFYGGFPPTFLRRLRAIFYEKKNAVHLFSGKVNLAEFAGTTVDIDPALQPDFVDDAQSLLGVPLEQFDLAICDPPYSVEDASHYQTSMVHRNLVMRALQRLPVGAHVAWLDQVLPMWRSDAFALRGVIGIVKSSNHRFRCLSIFERRDGPKSANVLKAEARALARTGAAL